MKSILSSMKIQIYRYANDWYVATHVGYFRKVDIRGAARYLHRYSENQALVISTTDRGELQHYYDAFMKQDNTPWKYSYISEYLSWLKKCYSTFDRGGRVQMSWAGPMLDQSAWRRKVREAMDLRINLKVRPEPIGRKYDEMYQTDLHRDKNDLHSILQRRVRIYQFRTPDVKRRFGHLLSSHAD